MAWEEVTAQRGRSSKIFQDSVDPLKKSYDGQTGTRWHYESVLDSGVYDTEVNMTIQRITAGGHDGWRVINSGWHYFLGNPNGLSNDGWVGFGGRQGDKWLMSRLIRVGYLHWPTRAWEDVGGAPTYNRANLTRENKSTEVPTSGASLSVSTEANWTGLWSTPGGGDVTLKWRADGNRLKEEIVLNEAGRNWIAANRPPSTPPAETYFGYVFRLGSADGTSAAVANLSNLPRWLKGGVLQNTEGDFDNDDGTEGITVQNAAQEFLFFLPIDFAYVEDPEATNNYIKLRKRIYKDGTDYFLLIGAKVTELNGLPAGDVIFDPTIDEQVGASGDDGWCSNNTTFNNTDNYSYLGDWYGDDMDQYYRFTGITITSGSTIDTSYLTHTAQTSQSGTTVNVTICAKDSADASAPTQCADFTGYTTATVAWNNIGSWTDATEYNSPSTNTIIQELVDDNSGLSSAAVVMFHLDNASSAARLDHAYDVSSSEATKLHIEYTAAAAGTEGPLVGGKLTRGGILVRGTLVG